MRFRTSPQTIAVLLTIAVFGVVGLSYRASTIQDKPAYKAMGSAATLEGTISFVGKPPKQLHIDTSADPICAKINPDPTTDWVIVTDQKLANVFVYVRGESLNSYSFDAPSGDITLEHKGCRYVPHVLGMQTQQTLRIVNSDPTTHNTHPTPKKIIYWDACIFLTWLKNEPCEPGVMEGIEETAKRVHNNQEILTTSIMTQTEVLESRLSKDAITKFENVFKRRNVEWINHDSRVGKLSHFIRDYYDQRAVKLSSPDCVHLASAILNDASVFYTLYGSGKKKRGHLLPLDGNVASYKLSIKKPYNKQLKLNLQPPGKGAK